MISKTIETDLLPGDEVWYRYGNQVVGPHRIVSVLHTTRHSVSGKQGQALTFYDLGNGSGAFYQRESLHSSQRAAQLLVLAAERDQLQATLETQERDLQRRRERLYELAAAIVALETAEE